MNREYFIVSDTGDEYSLSLSSDGLNLSDEISREFSIDLISIELARIRGRGVTSSKTLLSMETLIAEAFEAYPNAIIFYYCDFMNPIPASRKQIFAQEYRSKLFSCMFQRYVAHHDISGVSEVVVTVDGDDEPYFVHMIAREHHLTVVQKIGERLKEEYEK